MQSSAASEAGAGESACEGVSRGGESAGAMSVKRLGGSSTACLAFCTAVPAASSCSAQMQHSSRCGWMLLVLGLLALLLLPTAHAMYDDDQVSARRQAASELPL